LELVLESVVTPGRFPRDTSEETTAVAFLRSEHLVQDGGVLYGNAEVWKPYWEGPVLALLEVVGLGQDQ
jgi:hypothetical protein